MRFEFDDLAHVAVKNLQLLLIFCGTLFFSSILPISGYIIYKISNGDKRNYAIFVSIPKKQTCLF